MSIDFTPGVINTYNGDIYNCTTNTDNVKTYLSFIPEKDEFRTCTASGITCWYSNGNEVPSVCKRQTLKFDVLLKEIS